MFVGPGVPVILGVARSQTKQGLTSKLKNSRTYWKNLTKEIGPGTKDNEQS